MAQRHPFLAPRDRTLRIAHRGGARLYPENTLFAFREAVLRHRAQVLELDLQLTRDGVLVIAHDDTLDRCTDGEGPIAQRSFEELQALDAGHRFTRDGQSFPFRGQGLRLARFEALLEDELLGALPLNVDLKADRPGAEALLAEVVRAHRAADRVCVGSENDAFAGRIAAALPEACHFYPREALAAFVMAVYQGEPVPRDPRFHALDVPYAFEGFKVVQPPLVEAVAREGKWLNVWTVDEPEQMRELIALGVGGIMTDRPDLLAELLP